MNNYPYWLARVYYALTNQSPALIPTSYDAPFWAERIYRHVAGLPDSVAGGRSSSYWLERWFYLRTGQTHRMATGVMDDWFWLSKLYASYVGTDVNGLLQPAADEFWAQQLAGIPGLGGGASAPAVPVMSVTGNGVEITNGDATPDSGDHTQFAIKNAADNSDRVFTIDNTAGTADLTGVNVLVPSGYTVTVAPDATIAAGNSDTFTVRCNSATPGSAAGNITIESSELSDYVFAVACTVRTYNEKLLSIGTKKQQLRMIETSGTAAIDASPESNNGVYSGVTLNSAAGPVAGENAPLWDGVNDTLDAFSAGLAADFNGQEFTVGCWVKVSAAGVWTDATFRYFLHWFADANNEIIISKHGNNNTIQFTYRAGGTLKTVNHTISTTNWFRAEMVVSKAGDSMKCSVNGVQTGATQTGLGTFAGALAAARYGSRRDGAAFFHSGYLAYGTYDTTVLSDANVAVQAVVP